MPAIEVIARQGSSAAMPREMAESAWQAAPHAQATRMRAPAHLGYTGSALAGIGSQSVGALLGGEGEQIIHWRPRYVYRRSGYRRIERSTPAW